ncbi:MAG: WecB/TagA/CpsF family glycosyltransferase [Clostridium sp.]|nr:WecB/TagA/CpsF family glycosyltransferase [Clostridium sp.]
MQEFILDVPTDVVTLAEAVSWAQEKLNQNGSHFIASVNPEICFSARRNSALQKALLAADLRIPDGVGIVLASRLCGGQIRERVTGIDLMEELVALAAAEGKKIFLLGAAEGVAAAAAAKLKDRYPSLMVAGTAHGYLPQAQDGELAGSIAASGADLVFVALGSPRQELFVAEYGAASGAKILMVVGGSFDVLSGRLRRAPLFYQRLGLEWFFRLVQQPKRILRVWIMPAFLAAITQQRLFAGGRKHC